MNAVSFIRCSFMSHERPCGARFVLTRLPSADNFRVSYSAGVPPQATLAGTVEGLYPTGANAEEPQQLSDRQDLGEFNAHMYREFARWGDWECLTALPGGSRAQTSSSACSPGTFVAVSCARRRSEGQMPSVNLLIAH